MLCLSGVRTSRGLRDLSFPLMIITLSDSLIKETKKLKGLNFASTKNLSPLRDTLGFLGQEAVTRALKEAGEEVDAPPYLTDFKGDEYDFKWRGETWDVKTSPLGEAPPYCKNCRLLVKNDSKDKKIDNYVFAKIDLEAKRVYIVGFIGYNYFWEHSLPFKSKRVKLPCRCIFKKDLKDFEEYAKKSKR